MGDWELPPALVGRARAFLTGGGEPPAPRTAATVVLVRPVAPAGFQVYAIRRAASMAFASGMYAFPGGGVDPVDAAADVAWAGPAPREWGARLGLEPSQAQAVVCAAVRELFEETGVLLADGAAGVGGAGEGVAGEAVRQALVRRETHLSTVLAERGLALRSDLLGPWARWLTPEFEPRRYDTFFFVAALPAGQCARDVSGEADHTVWVTPAEALADPAMRMLPPTRATLRELARFPDVATLLAAAATRPITTVAPRAVLDPDGTVRLTH
ncbi:NUDIX hydrolase [Rhizomonospora bruguierae]|uniref:NUDIX hydrolase n=1 Tax=Rhizomonospora bruguierae TaxID=1581705 RepID=UPI001BCC80CD|nr:NUDIX hydrolase [Micromonospora sp. NBRC 107566]